MVKLSALIFAAAFVLGLAVVGRGADAPPATIRFNRDIRPLLTENCFACHGPDPAMRKQGLRFDREEGFFSDRKSGRPVVKGDPLKSLIYQRIINANPDEVMPPPKSHKSLKPEQKDLIRKWMEQGAPWEPHWSWIPPIRSDLPSGSTAGWIRNPIDAFILAKLDEKGLSPAAEADRPQLIRRVTFDLTGLPPTPQEIDAFVSDSSPNAYEALVDRLLASKSYGEHRARYWLDAVRYADTHGLHFDNYRELWPYRQWVINAFNDNKRFDQFATEQLAGDLLPDRTLDQQIASGFVRCNETTNEGGTIEEENLVLYARDRTDTAARIFLGLTAGCAVCHDHKFDPISAKDFYSLSAFFNNGTMGGLDGNIKDSPPSVVVPRPEDRARWIQVASDIGQTRQQIDARRNAAEPAFQEWLAFAGPDDFGGSLPTADVLEAPLDEGEGSIAHVIANGQARELPLATAVQWQPGELSSRAVQSPKGIVAELSDVGDFDSNHPYACSVWAKLPAGQNGAIISRMTEKDSFRGWDMWLQDNHIGAHLIHHWNDDAIKVVSKKPIDPGKWHHLCISYDGSSKADGMKVYVDGVPQETQHEADNLKGSSRTTVPFKIGQRDSSSPVAGLALQDLRIFGRALLPEEVRAMATNSRMAGIVAKSADKRSDPEKKDLFDWWLATTDSPFKELNEKLVSMQKESDEIKAHGAESLVMEERNQPATAFILFRGDYDKRRDKVEANTPTSLPPFPADAPRNRLGLAKWLLSPQNPLTARVTVNRYWQELFGTGLVKTSGDFGIMGEIPSHPELLDWLAVEFRESGWDTKHMFKLMVMSATYRQAALDTPQKVEKDPDNRLLARGPRYRLDAEEIRDQALAASGLLVDRIGGPSVRPYQPPNIWDVVGLPEGNTRNYIQDHGDNLYRRSLYTFWKRQAPPPSMELLNAPSRETCTVRRDLTDTPIQALVTMNDVTYVEAARNLAQHALQNGTAAFPARLNFISQRLIARSFKPEELAVAQSAYNDLFDYYRAHPDDARKLLEVGESKRDERLDPSEHAAWTMLTNQVMNLDEALNK